jgi:hypothetical protein
MTDRPILFSAPMIRALLDGRKTQTRRVLKPQAADWAEAVEFAPYKGFGAPGGLIQRTMDDYRQQGCGKARFVVGDRLWVKETWAKDDLIDTGARYYATDNISELRKKRPSIFMPRWASRLTIILTDVRVERLQAISEVDAMAEGIARNPHGNWDQWLDYPEGSSAAGWTDPRESYRSLWNSINGHGAWEANPWVNAISFDVVHANIDKVSS